MVAIAEVSVSMSKSCIGVRKRRFEAVEYRALSVLLSS
jgi:hypothetical protein